MRQSARMLVSAVGLLLASAAAAAPEVPAARPQDAESSESAHLPIPLSQRVPITPLATLDPATATEPEKLRALTEHNLAGRLPTQVGFNRELPQSTEVTLAAESLDGLLPRSHSRGLLASLDDETLVWATRIRLLDAYAFRILLTDAELPGSTRIWVYGADGTARGPTTPEHRGKHGVWTATIFGDLADLEVRVPRRLLVEGEQVHFRLESVGEIFRLDESGAPITGPGTEAFEDCAVDGMCKDSNDLSFIEDYRHGVANLIFESAGTCCFTCTGGLVNTTSGPEPYMMTARHCFSTQADAATLEAFWDHVTDQCDGTDPGLGSVPSTMGSDLLASSPSTDSTLVEITDTLPANRYHLGWSTLDQAHGTILHRLHHPNIFPQHYSRSMVDTSAFIECGSLPRPRFLYSELLEGEQIGGSSGSVVVIDNAGGQVVGQLFGACGFNLEDCDYDLNRTVDGAFRWSHFSTREWLDPPTAAGADIANPLSGFTLSGGQSANRNFNCSPGHAGDVVAFSFRGTVSGIGGNRLASDLQLLLTGPSESSREVGGVGMGINEWSFQGEQSGSDGEYRSSHVRVFNSSGDNTTSCQGTWTAQFTNDRNGASAVTWSDVEIILHKLEPGGGGCSEDHIVLDNEMLAGTQTFTACLTITATDTAVTGDIGFVAGQSIGLGSGFSVADGATFSAAIDPGLVP